MNKLQDLKTICRLCMMEVDATSVDCCRPMQSQLRFYIEKLYDVQVNDYFGLFWCLEIIRIRGIFSCFPIKHSQFTRSLNVTVYQRGYVNHVAIWSSTQQCNTSK